MFWYRSMHYLRTQISYEEEKRKIAKLKIVSFCQFFHRYLPEKRKLNSSYKP